MFVLFEAETLQILRYNVAETEGAGLVAGELLTDAKPPFNAATQKLVQKTTREGNNLRLGWNVVSLTQAELDAIAAAALREERVTAGLSNLTSDLGSGWGITITKESDLQGVIDQIYSTAASEIAAAGTLAQVKSVYVKQVGLLFRLIIYLFRVLR